MLSFEKYAPIIDERHQRYRNKSMCNVTDSKTLFSHGDHISLPDISQYTTVYNWVSITILLAMFAKVILQQWYPTKIITKLLVSMRRAIKKSVIFVLLVALVVVMLSSAAMFVYSADDSFMPIKSSVNSISTLLIGEVENFDP